MDTPSGNTTNARMLARNCTTCKMQSEGENKNKHEQLSQCPPDHAHRGRLGALPQLVGVFPWQPAIPFVRPDYPIKSDLNRHILRPERPLSRRSTSRGGGKQLNNNFRSGRIAPCHHLLRFWCSI